MSIGSRLKNLRISRNLTQKELSVKTGLSLSSIISYENDLRSPNLLAVAAIEKFFGITASYLLIKDHSGEKLSYSSENEFNFFKNVKNRRIELKLTQADLAKLSGVNQSYISQLEKAMLKPSLEVSLKISKALSMTIEELAK